jgi:hypothetical protein
MKIHATQLPIDEATFRAKLDAYRAEREAHRFTVNTPAPFPEYEIFRVIEDQGGALEIERDELQEQAEKVNRDALAELDELKAKIAQLERNQVD